jgi:hypothetical protein
LNTLHTAVKHCFPRLTDYFQEIDDFRQAGKVKYCSGIMMWMGVLERIAGFKSNNEFEGTLQTATETEGNLSLLGSILIDELPSIDGFCYFFQHLNPVELHKVICKMFRVLERKKFMKKLMTKDGYLLLAIDGVQTFSTKREIGHVVFRNHEGDDKTYHQYFLEAKIVSENGTVISLDTECVENPTEKFDKQDCEHNAAIRLLERIGREHPHLKFWILGDGLYCNSVIMDICHSNEWKFSFTFKGETKYPKLLGEINAEYNFSQRMNNCRRRLKKSKNTELYIELHWCNDLKYDLGNNGERSINYLAGKIIRVKNGVEKVVTTFSFLVSEVTCEADAFRKFMNCRRRWKIENEGFNFQKNNILYIGHNFSSRGYAGQNFYLLAQIAHTIIQLATLTDIAGQVRRQITGETDKLSQSLKTIFRTFGIIAQRIRVELLENIFKPPLIIPMRVRLKSA